MLIRDGGTGGPSELVLTLIYLEIAQERLRNKVRKKNATLVAAVIFLLIGFLGKLSVLGAILAFCISLVCVWFVFAGAREFFRLAQRERAMRRFLQGAIHDVGAGADAAGEEASSNKRHLLLALKSANDILVEGQKLESGMAAFIYDVSKKIWLLAPR